MMSTMKGAIFVLAVLWRVTNAEIVVLQPCSDGTTNQAENVTVDISDCGNPSNCSLVRGKTHYLTTTFVPTTDAPTLKMKIWGMMGPIKVPHGSSKDVCDEVRSDTGEPCSSSTGITRGTQYTHVAGFAVRRIYPEMSLKVRVLYYGGRKNKILCFEIPVHIVSSSD